MKIPSREEEEAMENDKEERQLELADEIRASEEEEEAEEEEEKAEVTEEEEEYSPHQCPECLQMTFRHDEDMGIWYCTRCGHEREEMFHG